MIRSNYNASAKPPPDPRQKYVPGSFIVAGHASTAPPHLTTMAANEKASKIREVKKLHDDRKTLTSNLETTRNRSRDLEAELRITRDDLSKVRAGWSEATAAYRISFFKTRSFSSSLRSTPTTNLFPLATSTAGFACT